MQVDPYIWPRDLNRLANIKIAFDGARDLCRHFGITEVSLTGTPFQDDTLTVHQSVPEIARGVVHTLSVVPLAKDPFYPIRLSSVFAGTKQKLQLDQWVEFRGAQSFLERRILKALTDLPAVNAG